MPQTRCSVTVNKAFFTNNGKKVRELYADWLELQGLKGFDTVHTTYIKANIFA
jgi:hypothetical protein